MIEQILKFLEKLISFPSVTPTSAGSIEYVATLLENNGFEVTIKNFGPKEAEATALYASYGNDDGINMCFSGHLDVVPQGNIEQWKYPPFEMSTEDQRIYGRGTVDMKGAVAAALASSIEFIKQKKSFKGRISFLLTTDEEGNSDAVKGMLQYIATQNHKIDFAVVGEPTCEREIGDIIKIGRRGSINFELSIQGTQGHVAYPDKAINPITPMVKICHALQKIIFSANDFFSPSQLQLTSIDVGNTVSNIIPNKSSCRFNLRFNDNYTSEEYVKQIQALVNDYITTYSRKHDIAIDYSLSSKVSAQAFCQDPKDLILTFQKIVKNTTGASGKFSTGGGTSDARFIKDYCAVVEFGLLSETAHKINESTEINHLQTLGNVYYNLLYELFSSTETN